MEVVRPAGRKEVQASISSSGWSWSQTDSEPRRNAQGRRQHALDCHVRDRYHRHKVRQQEANAARLSRQHAPLGAQQAARRASRPIFSRGIIWPRTTGRSCGGSTSAWRPCGTSTTGRLSTTSARASIRSSKPSGKREQGDRRRHLHRPHAAGLQSPTFAALRADRKLLLGVRDDRRRDGAQLPQRDGRAADDDPDGLAGVPWCSACSAGWESTIDIGTMMTAGVAMGGLRRRHGALRHLVPPRPANGARIARPKPRDSPTRTRRQGHVSKLASSSASGWRRSGSARSCPPGGLAC